MPREQADEPVSIPPEAGDALPRAEVHEQRHDECDGIQLLPRRRGAPVSAASAGSTASTLVMR
ncbi:hypothetical protein APR04_002506 [Promicromonospora umidemergens]|nr:hypothetical protein [Promicromonospora umidemergens]